MTTDIKNRFKLARFAHKIREFGRVLPERGLGGVEMCADGIVAGGGDGGGVEGGGTAEGGGDVDFECVF